MSYIAENIFEDKRVNTIGDKLLYFLTEAFTVDDVETDFFLTGSSAFILQDTGRGEAKNVVFATSNQEMYEYLAKNSKEIIQAKTVIKFKEKILLDFEFAKIEIWKIDAPIILFTYGASKFTLQEKTTIPINLL